MDLTPIQRVSSNLWLKRDDLFKVAGVCGSKARTAYDLIGSRNVNRTQPNYNIDTVVCGGFRSSTIFPIASAICKHYGLKCVCVTNAGSDTEEMATARKNGAEIISCNTWHANDFRMTAMNYAVDNNAYLLPFNLTKLDAVLKIGKQVKDIPEEIKQVVIPVGSGNNFVGVVYGLGLIGRTDVEVVGVQVGAPADEVVGMLKMISMQTKLPKYRIVVAPESYSTQVKVGVGDVWLDPIYEAKCVQFIDSDTPTLFWIVGDRRGCM